MEVGTHDHDMVDVTGGRPDGDGFGEEAPVGEAHGRQPSRFENAVHFLENLQRLGQVVHADDVGDDVEGIVCERQRGIHVQVLDDVLCQHLVLLQLRIVQPQPHYPLLLVALGVMADPAAAHVKYRHARGVARWERARVVLGECPNGRVVDVGHESGCVVENRIRRPVNGKASFNSQLQKVK